MNKLNVKNIPPHVGNKEDQITAFVFLCLGMIESLEKELITTQEVIEAFFNTENCLFIRNEFQVKLSDDIISHGVQLHDLWDTLPNETAQQVFQNELAKIHPLCLEWMDSRKIAA